MVQPVLDDPVQHHKEGVVPAGNGLRESGLGKADQRLLEPVVSKVEILDCRLPASFIGTGHRRPVLFNRRIGDRIPLHPLARDIGPGRDVEHELPNRVSVRDGTGHRLSSANAFQQLLEGRSVPSVAPKGSSQLIANSIKFSH